MTYFTKIPSWAYEDTFVGLRSFLGEAHESIFVFLMPKIRNYHPIHD